MTLYNNPRSIRFLHEETLLVLVIPGPQEPSLEQLNEVLYPVVQSMKQLYNGLAHSPVRLISALNEPFQEYRFICMGNRYPNSPIRNL